MLANFEITIKFNIAQCMDKIDEILDVHEIAETAAMSMADALTDYKAALCYEIVGGKVDAQ